MGLQRDGLDWAANIFMLFSRYNIWNDLEIMWSLKCVSVLSSLQKRDFFFSLQKGGVLAIWITLILLEPEMILIWDLGSEIWSVSQSTFLLLRCRSSCLPLCSPNSNPCYFVTVVVELCSASQCAVTESADNMGMSNPQYSTQLSVFPLSYRYWLTIILFYLFISSMRTLMNF